MPEPTPTEALVHDTIMEETPEQVMEETRSVPPASPPRANPGTPARPPSTTVEPCPEQANKSPEKSPEKSPGSGSGTNDEVQYLRTQKTTVDGPSTVVAKIPEPEIKAEANAHGKEPILYSEPLALEKMELPALLSTYFSRLSQHKGLEAELVTAIKQRHEVTFSPHSLTPKLQAYLNLL